MYTKDRARVFVHPSSNLFGVKSYDSKWLAYLESVQTTKAYLRGCCIATPLALLLFGGELRANKTHSIVTIDRWIGFNASERTLVLVRLARKHLDRLLDAKVADPALDISKDAIVPAIVRLLSIEKTLSQ